MKIKFEGIKIENFKSFTKEQFDFKELYTEFRGFNGVGKTTVLDAICWCLFGKDFLDRKQFLIRNTNDTTNSGKPFVELTISKIDEDNTTKEYVISNTLADNNVQTIQVDGVKFKKKDFELFLQEHLKINEEVFKTLSNVDYAVNLPQEKLKTLIMNLVGDITDEELFQDEKIKNEFKHIEKTVLIAGIEATKINLSKDKKELEEQMYRLEGKLEIKNADVLHSNIDVNEVEMLNSEKEKLYTKLSSIEESLNIENKKQNAKNDIKEKINELKEKSLGYQSTRNVLVQEGKSNKSEIDDRLNVEKIKQKEILAIENKIDKINYDITTVKNNINRENKNLVELRQEMQETKDKAIIVNESKCITCGQDLPISKIDEMKQSLVKQKETKLKAIQTRGLETKEHVSRLEEKLKLLEKELEFNNDELKSLDTKDYSINLKVDEYTESLQKRNEEIKIEIDKVETLNKKNVEEFNVLKEQYQNMPDGDTSNVQSTIELKDKIKSIDERLSVYTMYELNKKQYDELVSEKDVLLKKQRTNLIMLKLIDAYKTKKSNIIKERVEGNFNIIKFKTFETIGNDDVRECFKLTYQDRDYSAISFGEKIKVSLDLLVSIQKMKNIYVPILIDSIGELDQLPNFAEKSQIIACRTVPKPKENDPKYNDMVMKYGKLFKV